jgi:hypothetical protein
MQRQRGSPRLPFNPSYSYFNYSSLLRTPFFSFLVICLSALASEADSVETPVPEAQAMPDEPTSPF